MAFCHRWQGRWHLRELWSSQYCCEMIDLLDCRAWSANSVLSWAESVREMHSILPFDFPVKSGSWIYLINMGIHLLICSGKLCCVLDVGDFCSWKPNFGVGMYVVWKYWFAIFRVKVTVRAGLIKVCWFLIYLLKCLWPKYDCFYYIFWTADPFAIRLFFIEFYCIPECLELKKKKKSILCSRSRSQQNFKCQWMLVWTRSSEQLITKLSILMHHYEPKCNAKRLLLLFSRSRSQWRLI